MTTPKEIHLKQKIEKSVFEAMGYGSLCWKPKPEGIFSPETAKPFGDKTVNDILQVINDLESSKNATIRELVEWIEENDRMWGGMIFIRNGQETTLREVLGIKSILDRAKEEME